MFDYFFDYFDLNKRAQKAWESTESPPILYVSDSDEDDESQKPQNNIELTSKQLRKNLSKRDQWLLYIGVFIGVVFSSAVNQLKSGAFPKLEITLTSLILSPIIAIMIIPNAYDKKIKFSPELPFIVQFGLFVQQGVFWHVIFDSIASTVSSL